MKRLLIALALLAGCERQPEDQRVDVLLQLAPDGSTVRCWVTDYAAVHKGEASWSIGGKWFYATGAFVAFDAERRNIAAVAYVAGFDVSKCLE